MSLETNRGSIQPKLCMCGATKHPRPEPENLSQMARKGKEGYHGVLTAIASLCALNVPWKGKLVQH